MTIPQRFVAGALDLGQLKQRAQQKAQAQDQQRTGAGPGAATGAASDANIAPFFEVTPDNIEDLVLRRSAQVPVVVLLGSSRSPQSEQLKADFAELAQAGGLRFVVGYVDADAQPAVAQMFGIQSVPTVVALAAGQPLTHFAGAQPRELLAQWVDALVEQVGPQLEGLPAAGQAPEEPELDPRVAVAEQALNAGDFDAAIAAYEAILAEDPGATDIRQARDTTRLLQRLKGVEDPIAAADQDPSAVAQMAAADAEIVAGVPEQAFARLIAVMRESAPDERTTVRDRLLELFGLFDAGDPRVLEARTALASALY